MSIVLGIDTSNYTTSAAVYDSCNNQMLQQKMLLPVREGELGLRQSDAVFHHTRQLPEVIEALLSGFDGRLSAIAASDRPSQSDGSYMPCFLSGLGSASDWQPRPASLISLYPPAGTCSGCGFRG